MTNPTIFDEIKNCIKTVYGLSSYDVPYYEVHKQLWGSDKANAPSISYHENDTYNQLTNDIELEKTYIKKGLENIGVTNVTVNNTIISLEKAKLKELHYFINHISDDEYTKYITTNIKIHTLSNYYDGYYLYFGIYVDNYNYLTKEEIDGKITIKINSENITSDDEFSILDNGLCKIRLFNDKHKLSSGDDITKKINISFSTSSKKGNEQYSNSSITKTINVENFAASRYAPQTVIRYSGENDEYLADTYKGWNTIRNSDGTMANPCICGEYNNHYIYPKNYANKYYNPRPLYYYNFKPEDNALPSNAKIKSIFVEFTDGLTKGNSSALQTTFKNNTSIQLINCLNNGANTNKLSIGVTPVYGWVTHYDEFENYSFNTSSVLSSKFGVRIFFGYSNGTATIKYVCLLKVKNIRIDITYIPNQTVLTDPSQII